CRAARASPRPYTWANPRVRAAWAAYHLGQMRRLTWFLRYGLPVILIVIGFVVLFTFDGSVKWDGWAMFVGSGLAVAFFNALFRYGAKGDEERDAEDAARDYFSRTGHWPDETPRQS